MYREKLGMTQPEAGERAGLSQATWSRIETGAKIPTVGEVLGLSWALGVPFSTVLGKSDIRDRLRFAARSNSGVLEADHDLAEEIKEEIVFLAELADELAAAGYLPARG
jgi:transcriptional regulator with XRE-family HTH domain